MSFEWVAEAPAEDDCVSQSSLSTTRVLVFVHSDYQYNSFVLIRCRQ